MKEKILFFVCMFIFIPFASAQTVDAEIANIISYAEQYEMGNMDYLELLIQASLAEALQKRSMAHQA